ncbi:MAG TPA: phosphopantetheine-binding protein [Bacteroidales bacterium]|nr:phosphopantetheine-binding protein [Bacteroidales bacterium]
MNVKFSYEEISSEVKSAIAEIVGIEDEELHDDMSLISDLGIDSLDLVDLLFGLGRKFDVEISIQYWTEKIHSESLKIEEVGVENTLLSISELTGLEFDENDSNLLKELISGDYQTWDVVRTILSFIKIKSLCRCIEIKTQENHNEK